jgi:hypothetical protein
MRLFHGGHLAPAARFATAPPSAPRARFAHVPLAVLALGLVFSAESAAFAAEPAAGKPARARRVAQKDATPAAGAAPKDAVPGAAPPKDSAGTRAAAPEGATETSPYRPSGEDDATPAEPAPPVAPVPGSTPAAQEGSHTGTGEQTPAAAPSSEGSDEADTAPTPAPGKASSSKPPEEDAESARIPLARDTLGGHIAVGAAASLYLPYGSLQEGQAQTDLMDPGFGFRLDAGYGVSRTVVLGVYGEFASPQGDGVWAGKRAQSISAGPFIRYHLVQGVRFDPWVGFGVGFRRTSHGDESYTGFDFARLQLGGDFYGLSQFGFGPLVEFAMGTFVAADGVALGTKSVNANLTVGIRFTFDGPGK